MAADSLQLRELPDDEHGRRWSVSMRMEISPEFAELLATYGCMIGRAVFLPDDPNHPLWQALVRREASDD